MPFLYPYEDAVQKPIHTRAMVEDYWEYDSTYRGIEITRWMPGTLAYGAWIDGDWIVNVSKSVLKGLIDDWLGPVEPVDEPYTVIDNFIVPASLPAGAFIGELTVVTRNAGTATGYLSVAINSERYTEAAGTSYPTRVAPGGAFTFHLALQINRNMPNEDFTLTATNDDGTSQVTKTITLSALVVGITDVETPSQLEAGEIPTLTILYDVIAPAGLIQLLIRIYNIDTGALVCETDTSYHGTGAYEWHIPSESWLSSMPAGAWNLRVEIVRWWS